MPCVPDFIQGVVNIRGEILSVTDLAKIMGLGSGVDVTRSSRPRSS